jgi:hypothetical protein
MLQLDVQFIENGQLATSIFASGPGCRLHGALATNCRRRRR